MFRAALPAKAWIAMAPTAFNSAAAALLLLASTALANAATISIGYELPSFTPTIITLAGQAVDPGNGYVSANGFGVNTWTSNSSGYAPNTTTLIGNVAVNVANPDVMNTFSVYITMSNIPFQDGDINPVTINNDMTASFTGPSMDGWILNFTTYIDPDNRVFEKQIYLNGGPVVWNPASSPTHQHYVATFPYALPQGQPAFANFEPGDLYSVTQFYSFVAPSPPVHTPGPLVGAGIPGLVTGMLGLLVWARGRRQRQQS
jgi:hypothetical protein